MDKNYFDNSDRLTSNGQAVATIEMEGDRAVAPKYIIPSAASAKTLYEQMADSHRKRAFKYAKIQGLIDGNSPFKRVDMARAGKLSDSNTNWRDAEAHIDNMALTFWSLSNQVQHIIQITTNITGAERDPRIGEIASKHLDYVIRAWPEFQRLMTVNQHDNIKFGNSFFAWPDEDSWMFENVDIYGFLVPERTKNATHSIPHAMIESKYDAHYLWKVYTEGEDNLWDKKALEDILFANRLKVDTNNDYSKQTMADIQRKIRNNDCAIDEVFQPEITLISVLAKEWSGKVTRAMFHPNFIVNPNNQDYKHRGFAYFNHEQYDSFQDAIMMFTYTPGEQYIHGNKGVGHRIFNALEAMLHLDNSIFDGARRASSVLIRNKNGRNKDIGQIKGAHGALIDIGEGGGR